VPTDYPPDLYWKGQPPKEEYNYVLVDVEPGQKTKFTLNRFDRGRRSHSEPRSYSSEEVAADCGSAVLATTLLIVHSLVAVAAAWRGDPPDVGGVGNRGRTARFVFLAAFVPCRRFVSPTRRRFVRGLALLGAILYLYFLVDVRPELSAPVTGMSSASSTSRSTSRLSDWPCYPRTGFGWRRPHADESAQTRTRSPRSLPLLSGGAS